MNNKLFISPLKRGLIGVRFFSDAPTAVQTKSRQPRRKVIKLRDERPIILSQRARNAELEKKAKESGLPWRVLGSGYVFISASLFILTWVCF
jgi:hypothetical protein